MSRKLCLSLALVCMALVHVACQPVLKPASAGTYDVILLSWDDAGRIQLFELALGEEEPKQLTESERSVTDYAVAQNTGHVAYVVDGGRAGSEIWLAGNGDRPSTLLVDCGRSACDRPVWHPEGSRLVYERRPVDSDGFVLGSELWWLDTKTAESTPLLADPDAISQSASFSPDGEWISYAGSPDEGIFAYNFANGRKINVASEMGTAAAWHPDGGEFIVRNLQLVVLHGSEGSDHQEHSHDFAQAVHLFAVTVPDGLNRSVSGDNIVDDSAPAFSPDGQWIVFSRKLPRTRMGGQLWRMRSDGSDAQALTDDPEFSHAAPSWSPDGRYVLFQRFSVLDQDADPEIWYLEIVSGRMHQVLANGFRASWWPTSP